MGLGGFSVSLITQESCFNIPPEFSVGDELFIVVAGHVFGNGYMKCLYAIPIFDQWLPGFLLCSSFVVTE
jgi:hypothetical protein